MQFLCLSYILYLWPFFNVGDSEQFRILVHAMTKWRRGVGTKKELNNIVTQCIKLLFKVANSLFLLNTLYRVFNKNKAFTHHACLSGASHDIIPIQHAQVAMKTNLLTLNFRAMFPETHTKFFGLRNRETCLNKQQDSKRCRCSCLS